MPRSHTTGAAGRLLTAAFLAAALVTGGGLEALAAADPVEGEPPQPRYRQVRPPPGPARGVIDVPAWVVWVLGAGIFGGSIALAIRSHRAAGP